MRIRVGSFVCLSLVALAAGSKMAGNDGRSGRPDDPDGSSVARQAPSNARSGGGNGNGNGNIGNRNGNGNRSNGNGNGRIGSGHGNNDEVR
jgi:hypothetical protein